MLGNEACPNYLNGGTPQQYKDYRLFVVSRFKLLNFLDGEGVTEQERVESEKIYGVIKTRNSLLDPGRLQDKGKKKVGKIFSSNHPIFLFFFF